MKLTTLLLTAATMMALNTTSKAITSQAPSLFGHQAAVLVDATAAQSTASKSAGKTIKQLIPDGYEILLQEKGDLNGDKIDDVVLILKDVREADEPDNDQLVRPLLLLIGNKNGGYYVARRNDHAVYCANCGGSMGDPVQGITIKKGYFSIENYGGSGMRWLHVVTFKYDAKDKEWYLHRDGHESFHSAEPEKILEQSSKTSKDFGKIKFEHYNLNEAL